MYIENTGLENLKIDLNTLDEILPQYGLIRAGQWDYERVTYDRKIVIKEHVYYLRVQGVALEGDVGAHDAYIQLKKPILGKYYYPHGIEYGEDENFPNSLVSKCEETLVKVQKELEALR
ncbi:YugN-like family protein [Caldibacillus lycopersici]|uniref:YugN-like family protein n=1 Tax=Perspicuibacillus lycopersici TaxID=1325689 RepID=A0AAE3IRP3_9BACI|nr:YugN-like family protein [Perspicuibacillus lycopersici]MCU9612229.1 YugN-like family protein [Perspicuibacillus lycopersici]